MGTSVTLVDIDCTIERRQLDFGPTLIEAAEQAAGSLGRTRVVVRGRGELGLIIHLAVERGGADVKRIVPGEFYVNRAAVVFQAVDAIGEKIAIKHDISRGRLRKNARAVVIHQPEVPAD